MNDSGDNNHIKFVLHKSGRFRLVKNSFGTNKNIPVNHIYVELVKYNYYIQTKMYIIFI